MKIKSILFIALAFVTFTFTNCSDDGESGSDGPNSSTGALTDSDKAKLLEKYWFTGMGINFYFFEDGVFRLNKSLDGSWAWVNKSDTMLVTNYDGKKYRNIFLSIGSNKPTYVSDQGGDNFQTMVTLSDTE